MWEILTMETYGIFSLLPPLAAITLAMITKKVIPSLFLGVWVAGFMTEVWPLESPVYLHLLQAPINGSITTVGWLVENGTQPFNFTILLFDFIIGGSIGVLYKAAAIRAVAESAVKYIRSSKSASIMAAALGTAIFFDDYTNTVVSGNTMRDISDRLRVSREKLSYIVDSTAAPIAGLAMFSTWIGFMLGLIESEFDQLGIEIGGFLAYLRALPFQFYAIFAIILVWIVVLTNRNYGGMLKAEIRARETGKVLADDADPMIQTESDLGDPVEEKGSVLVFVVSILGLAIGGLLGLWVTGGGMETYTAEGLTGVLGDADSATALLWASFIMLFFASMPTLIKKTIDIKEWVEGFEDGMKLMIKPTTILLLAWSIGSATSAVGTDIYVQNLAELAGLWALMVPLIIFIAAAFIAFTTGTSWGTFAIMMPIAIPTAYSLAGDEVSIALYASIAAVFSGGIMGDHVSPISDTTIMSSLFTGADHVDHVKTQAPYALTAGAVGVILFTLLAAGLTSWFVLLPIGIVLLVLGHLGLSSWWGKKEGLPKGRVPTYHESEEEGEVEEKIEGYEEKILEEDYKL